jgi:hypothetical protein
MLLEIGQITLISLDRGLVDLFDKFVKREACFILHNRARSALGVLVGRSPKHMIGVFYISLACVLLGLNPMRNTSNLQNLAKTWFYALLASGWSKIL